MKFSCYKSDLLEALLVAMPVVAVKPMTPVLSGVYLAATDSKLELQANNNQTGIRAVIPIHVEETGEVVVSGKRFQDFVKNMPDDTITIFTEDNALRLESGGASVELLTMPASDFPKVNAPATDKAFSLPAATLGNLIRKTAFAVAKDDSRPLFKGIGFELGDDKISLFATNTHRIAVAKGSLTDCTNAKFVVPAETLKPIVKKLTDYNDVVNVRYSGTSIAFKFDNYFITARLIEGEFPPYDKVIPKSSSTRAKVDTAEFRSAVEFVALMSKETEYNTVRFVFDRDGLEISANCDVGGAVKNIEAQVDGDDLDIAFNVDYIVDVLRVLDDKELNIALNDCFSPAAFTTPNDKDYIYVATPVRMR